MSTPVKGFIRSALVTLMIGFSAGLEAHGQELFVASTARAEIVATDDMRRHSPGLIAHRYVRVDEAMLARLLGTNETARASRALGAAVALTIKPGVTARFERLYREIGSDGTITWSGRQSNNGTGSAVFVADRGGLMGHIHIGDRFYRVAPAGGGFLRVSEFDTAAGRPDIVRPVPTPRSSQDVEPDTSRAVAFTYINVLVAYTNKARLGAIRAGWNIVAETNLAFALANVGFANSGLNVRLRNVGLVPAPLTYNEDRASYEGGLTAITSSPVFGGIRNLRNSRRADLVALMREGGSYCGIAWLIENPSPATANYGFSVFSRDCVTYHVFAHEIGHNIGLNHDRYVVPIKPAGTYNYGHVNLAFRIRTIMSYNNFCIDRGVSCATVNMFSTPLRRSNGRIVGSAFNDNARMIRRNAALIAAYR